MNDHDLTMVIAKALDANSDKVLDLAIQIVKMNTTIVSAVDSLTNFREKIKDAMVKRAEETHYE